MKQKISLEDLPNLVVDLSMKVELLLEEISNLKNNEEATPIWLDIDALSNYLKLSKQTIYQYCSARKLPYHKIGGVKGKYTIFLKSEIDQWLLGSNIKSEAEITNEALQYTKHEK